MQVFKKVSGQALSKCYPVNNSDSSFTHFSHHACHQILHEPLETFRLGLHFLSLQTAHVSSKFQFGNLLHAMNDAVKLIVGADADKTVNAALNIFLNVAELKSKPWQGIGVMNITW